jgi:membrane-associated phospholipid phosphatase
MNLAESGRESTIRRNRINPSIEPLEARLVLSHLTGHLAAGELVAREVSPSMTISTPAHANGTINGVATNRMVVIRGQTFKAARVDLQVGGASHITRAGALGNYQFRLPMGPGNYVLTVHAKSPKGQVASASMSMTHGDAVIAWINTMIDVLRNDAGNVGLASRTIAMTSAAVYDAVNDIERTAAVFKIDVHAPRWASPQAAASEAAYTVLSALDPSMSSLLNATMAQSLAAVAPGRARDAGIAIGRKVADGILAWRANDGSAASVPYVPGTSPGQWRPTPPTYTDAWGPEWGKVKPFAIASPAAYMPPPPPALNTSAYASALNQVESLGAANSTTRTASETQAAMFWSYDLPSNGTPPAMYDQVAETIALQMHNTLAQNARLFGLVNVAIGDAAIVAWNSKYTYNFWRPITAIQLADTDGNPATVADPTWTPMGFTAAPGTTNVTPPWPGYVSGHSTFGGAIFTVLADFYGTNDIHFTLRSDELPGITRSYASFSAAALENAMSRVWIGVHFAFDCTEGLAIGDELGNNIYKQIMGPASNR